MAEVIKGIAVVWGNANVTFTGVVTSSLAQSQSADFNWQAETAVIRSEIGTTVGKVYYDSTKTITLTAIPSGTTIAAAKTNLGAMLLAPGTLVTVVDADGAVIDGTHSGKFILETVTWNATNDGPQSVTMNLIQYVENDISATAAAGP